jgi:hypothetical protein
MFNPLKFIVFKHESLGRLIFVVVWQQYSLKSPQAVDKHCRKSSGQ